MGMEANQEMAKREGEKMEDVETVAGRDLDFEEVEREEMAFLVGVGSLAVLEVLLRSQLSVLRLEADDLFLRSKFRLELQSWRLGSVSTRKRSLVCTPSRSMSAEDDRSTASTPPLVGEPFSRTRSLEPRSSISGLGRGVVWMLSPNRHANVENGTSIGLLSRNAFFS